MRVYKVTASNHHLETDFVVRALNSTLAREIVTKKIRDIFGTMVGVQYRMKDTKIRN